MLLTALLVIYLGTHLAFLSYHSRGTITLPSLVPQASAEGMNEALDFMLRQRLIIIGLLVASISHPEVPQDGSP